MGILNKTYYMVPLPIPLPIPLFEYGNIKQNLLHGNANGVPTECKTATGTYFTDVQVTSIENKDSPTTSLVYSLQFSSTDATMPPCLAGDRGAGILTKIPYGPGFNNTSELVFISGYTVDVEDGDQQMLGSLNFTYVEHK